MGEQMPSVPLFSGSRSKLPPLRQILLSALDIPAAENQRRQLAQYGVTIVSRKILSAIGMVLSTYRVPENVDIDELTSRMQKMFPDATVEANQRFRLLAGSVTIRDKHAYGLELAGLRVPSQCHQAVSLAMLDSAVSHDFISAHSKRLRYFNVTNSKSPPTGHGTSIASLLISDSAEYPGLLPLASLDVINVFVEDENGEPETHTDWLLKGLNLLAELKPTPKAVNLSFGGRYSALLEAAFLKLSDTMHFAGAAGNDGTEAQVYPAAYDTVYAVGAVDAQRQITRLSNRGGHVLLFAPGEDVWTMDAQGQGFYGSGTSFATPFATAALALLNDRNQSVSDYLSTLGASRLVMFSTLCP